MTLSLTRRRTPLASVSVHLVWISGTRDTDGEALGVQDRGDVLHRRPRGVVHRQDDALHRALACPHRALAGAHRAPRRLSARQHRVGLVHDVRRPPPQPLALFLALGARSAPVPLWPGRPARSGSVASSRRTGNESKLWKGPWRGGNTVIRAVTTAIVTQWVLFYAVISGPTGRQSHRYHSNRPTFTTRMRLLGRIHIFCSPATRYSNDTGRSARPAGSHIPLLPLLEP